MSSNVATKVAGDETDRFSGYQPLRPWVSAYGGHIFSSFSAAEWFIRGHRAELVRSGQLIVRRGAAGSLVGPQFERVVLDILRGESLRTLEQEAAA
ncbi:hypothetical protein [uncultured Thiodictyon sp.]|uniref:hypothetical protein n=1 Tax=uncultured Thiodictyon sp. TaxID=1846217 RepID=UPI0025E14C70|nr:hypothetical protein [uncultured Thiodictyon sp.]